MAHQTNPSLPPADKIPHQQFDELAAELRKTFTSQTFHHLYVCARNQGRQVISRWIRQSQDFDHEIYQLLQALSARKITSLEAEYLYQPEQRQLIVAKRKPWNSLRGKRAAIITHNRRSSYWSALEMIARNLSFQRIAELHLDQYQQSTSDITVLDITLYKTEQYFYDLTSTSNNNPSSICLYRGNQVVSIEQVTPPNLHKTIESMTHWLATQVNDEGRANYKYWPSRGRYAPSNNAIRQWMATVCLNRVAIFLKKEDLRDIAAKNLKYNLSQMYRQTGKLGYIWLNNSAKLGAAALAALAILESPFRHDYQQAEQGLRRLINELSNADGSFDTFYYPRERKDNQNFYSGEALLFLASLYKISLIQNYWKGLWQPFGFIAPGISKIVIQLLYPGILKHIF